VNCFTWNQGLTCSPTPAWLDRYPELWPDYFGHHTRVVRLAREPAPELAAEAVRIAARFGLPLTIVRTGLGRLEAALAELFEGKSLNAGRSRKQTWLECGGWRRGCPAAPLPVLVL
jgi:hypothetical protein